MRNVRQIQHKRVALQWISLINTRDLEGICRITVSNWQMHGVIPSLPPGHEGVRRLFAHFGHSGQHMLVEDVITEGDRVAVRATNHWREDGLLGIAPKTAIPDYSAMFIHRISDGLITETWWHADDLSRLIRWSANLSSGEEKEDSTKLLVKNIFTETMQALRKIYVY